MKEFSFRENSASEKRTQHDKPLQAGHIPNSAMLSMVAAASSGDGSGRGGDELGRSLAARMPGGRGRPQAQIAAAEREADSLAAHASGSSPQQVSASMGARLGADFGGVTFHTDAATAERVSGMGARAYTAGSHVYFGHGGFDPHVAAHELVHTVQQGAVAGGGVSVSAPMGGIQMIPDDEEELLKEGDGSQQEQEGAASGEFEGGEKDEDVSEQVERQSAQSDPMAMLKDAPAPRREVAADQRGMQSAEEFAQLKGASEEWKSFRLPTAKEFEKSTGMLLVGRSKALKSIAACLDAYHAASGGKSTERITDRVAIFGALRRLVASCEAYLGSGGIMFDKRKSAVRDLRNTAYAGMSAISGGQHEEFDFAATSREMEADAYAGMNQDELERKHFGTDKEKRSRQKNRYENTVANMARVTWGGIKRDELNAEARRDLRTQAIIGTMHKEEIDDMADQFVNDQIMSGILQEIKDTRDKVHYTAAGGGAIATIEKRGEKDDSRYIQQTTVFSPDKYYGGGNDAQKKPRGYTQMDMVHEATHVVNGETFKGAGRNWTVPVDMLGTSDEDERKSVMREIENVVVERNRSADELQHVVDEYLACANNNQPAPGNGFNYERGALVRMRQLAGYTFGERGEVGGDKNRVVQTWEQISGIRAGRVSADANVGSGLTDVASDPSRYAAYEAFAKRANADKKSKQETKAAGGDPYTMFSNALVEYDSTVNEMYYYVKSVGVDKEKPGDRIYQLLKKAAADALEYRRRFRGGVFQSNTTAKGQ